jgi:hypothetical protein
MMFLKLLRQTMDAIKLHQRPHLIYRVDETGIKLAYNSGNQKLLIVKDSRRIHNAVHGEKGETVTITVCMSASGSNCFLPIVLCKGK